VPTAFKGFQAPGRRFGAAKLHLFSIRGKKAAASFGAAPSVAKKDVSLQFQQQSTTSHT
jgi:hypothetical protein